MINFDCSKEILKDIVKSSTGHLSKKDIYSYISPGSAGLRFDEFYMVYRYILNMARKSKKHKDQIEAVFVVNISILKRFLMIFVSYSLYTSK